MIILTDIALYPFIKGICKKYKSIKIKPIARNSELDIQQYDKVIIASFQTYILAENLYRLAPKYPDRTVYLVRSSVLRSQQNFLNEEGEIDESLLYPIPLDKPFFMHLETHIVDYCNLNCKGCLHFSPFYGKTKTDPEQYEHSLQVLSQKVPRIYKMVFSGGEPLLDPELTIEIIKIARKYYPDSEFNLITNGTLLRKMDSSFFEELNKYNVLLEMSLYPPIKEKFDELKSLLNENGVTYTSTEDVVYFSKVLNPEPIKDVEKGVQNCNISACYFMMDNKIYKCPLSGTVNKFNEETGGNINHSEGIDIDEIDDGWDCLSKLMDVDDICQYCSWHLVTLIPWERSSRPHKSEDWYVDPDNITKVRTVPKIFYKFPNLSILVKTKLHPIFRVIKDKYRM